MEDRNQNLDAQEAQGRQRAEDRTERERQLEERIHLLEQQQVVSRERERFLEQQAEQQAASREREREQLRQAAEQLRIRDGTYYTTISELWYEDRKLELSEEEYSQIRRKAPTTDDADADADAGITKAYYTTLELAQNDNSIAKVDQHNSRSSNQATKLAEKIWPKDVVGNRRRGHIAHLAPAGVENVRSWWFLACWLYGEELVQSETLTFEFCMKILNGCGLIDDRNGTNNRRPHSGIKHWVTNKARIYGQNEILDSNPCLLIVPILSLDKVVNWKGEGYSAIVVIDAYQNELNLRDVASASNLSQDPVNADTANNEDVEKARNLLEKYLRGSLTSKRIASESQHFKFPEEYPRIYEYKSVPDQKITVPVNLKVSQESMKVRKVTFERFNRKGDNGGHPAPDPILLTAKAACVFSQRHENEAMAASAGPDDIDDNWSEGDDAALEQFIEAQQNALRPPDNWNDFARAMGQSGATQPRDWSESKGNGNGPIQV